MASKRLPRLLTLTVPVIAIFTILSMTAQVQAQTQVQPDSPPADESFSPEIEARHELDLVTVVAHRQPRQMSEVAGTVTVIGEDRLSRDMVFDVADLVRYEPGVQIDHGSTRFGFGGFRIRGVGGNRTAMVVDNVPVSDQFDIGAFANTGRGLIELGLAQRVEILRGPASTLYGSKALGGVVAIRTLDADDLITTGEHGSRISLRGASDSDRLRLTAATAFERGNFSLLIAGAALKGSELDPAGRSSSTALDRLDLDQQSVLLRGGMETSAGRLRLTLDGSHESRDADLQAVLGHGRQVFSEALLGDDRRDGWRLLVDQELAPLGGISRGHWRSWWQHSETRQETLDLRPNAPQPVDVFRRFEFEQQGFGLGADLESDLVMAGRSHRLGYGFEYSDSRVTSQRDGTETDRTTGAVSKVILGEAFPLRDFPRSNIRELGLYVHDEIHLWQGGPMLSPGIRWEYYDLSLRNDSLFEASFPELETTDLRVHSWLPRLGLLWPMGSNMEFFAQYARGLRAPPFSDVNIGLEYIQYRVRSLSNPDLKPERGRTVEAGLRWRGHEATLELALFRNEYRDFIQTRAPLGFDPVSGFNLFQSINRDRVRIEGMELRAHQELGAGLHLGLNAEWARGKDLLNGQALPDVSPPTAMVELGWESSDMKLDSRLIATAARGQRSLVDNAGEELFSAPGYMTLDLLTRWRPNQEFELSAGLFNLGNRQYWLNGRVSGFGIDEPEIPLLAEAGRWFMLNLTWHR